MNQEILQAYLRQEETPAYIFDLDMLKSRVQMMKTILGERAEICFAMKVCIQSNPGSIWSFWKCVQKKKTLRFMH